MFMRYALLGLLGLVACAGFANPAFGQIGPATPVPQPASVAGPCAPVSYADEGAAGEEKLYGFSVRKDPAERKILAALDKRIEIDFIETPLQDVVDFFKDALGIEIQIDCRALDDVGIGSDTPVSLQLQHATARAALKHLLRQLDLTYVIRDEVLLITTPEEAEARLITRLYPVTDLVAWPSDEGETAAGMRDFDTLSDLITSTVAVTTWQDVGGPGSLGAFSVPGQDLLVVSQTQDVHKDVVALLRLLRKCRHRPLPKSAKTLAELKIELPQDAGLIEFTDPDHAKVVEALEKPVSIEAIELELRDVMDTLGNSIGIDILIDVRSLEDVGIGDDTPVTCDLKGARLFAALRRLLRQLDLTFVVRDGLLLITTPEEAQSQLATRFYNVPDLALVRDANGRLDKDFDTLIDIITSTIAPTTWCDVGGPGSVEGFSGPCHTVLVVSQTDEVHADIAKLLARLRQFVDPNGPIPPRGAPMNSGGPCYSVIPVVGTPQE